MTEFDSDKSSSGGRATRMRPATIEEYIAGFPPDVQARLESVRHAIRKAAPGAQEKISYGIPTFALRGNLVHFAAFRNHVGFYPGAAGIAEFVNEFAGYETSKGTVRFPVDRPIPLALIEEVVRFRVRQNLAAEKPAPRS